MNNLTELIENIIHPSEEFTPIPFWFLNDTLKKEVLKDQLMDFKRKGVNGVVLHPRIGIPKTMAYLSEDYFSIICFLVRTASELNMRIVLYDEAMYPSGSAHGEVVKANPSFASLGITLCEESDILLKHGEKIIFSFADHKCLVQKYCGGTIRGIHYGEDDNEKNAPLSADILNPSAVDKFIELTHEQYYAHLKKFFGNTIIGFFTDEPCILGRNTRGFFEWTDGLEKEILALGGKLEELRGLFEGETNPTIELYHQILIERLNQVYYKKLSDWCFKHGIALMGHPKESDDIDEEEYFQIPGQDLVFRFVSPEKGGISGIHSAQAKCSSDAARHAHKCRNSNECFGVCSRDQIPWYFTGSDMKWFIDWLGVRGVNLFIPHAFYYSLRNDRKAERPPDVGPNNIWWKYYRFFSDYMKRISYLMTDSKNCAKVAVLCKSGSMPVKEVVPFYENQIEFNYVPISYLKGLEDEENANASLEIPSHKGKKLASITKNKLYVGGYKYEYLLSTELSRAWISNYSLKNHLPVLLHSYEEIPFRDFFIEQPYKDLRVTHLVKNGIDLYLLVNEGETPIHSFASVPIKGTPVAFNLWGGYAHYMNFEKKEDRTRFFVELDRRESLLILFDENGELFVPKKPVPRLLNEIPQSLTLVSHHSDPDQKVYHAIYCADKIDGEEGFQVKGEEMIECYCNGEFAGVSFWNPHIFSIGSLLHKGENEITLVVTGNIANQYSGQTIPYGIEIENKL